MNAPRNPPDFVTRRAFVLHASMAAAAAAVGGCASNSQMNGVWVHPDAGMRKAASQLLVIGVIQDNTARRIFEDAVVTQLAARGVAARPSYLPLPELGPLPPPDIESRLRSTGAEAVLVSRAGRVRTDLRVTPGYSPGPAGFHGMWGGPYSTPPNVYTVQSVEVETRLFDTKDLALLWSGTSTTQPTSSMQRTIAEFAALLVKALAEARVIA